MADHRALRVVDEIRTLLLAQETLAGNNVHIGRWLTIDEAEGSVMDIEIGSDDAVSEFGTDAVNHIDSVIRIYVDLYDYTHQDGRDLLGRLFQMRSEVHIALLADVTLGLSFVLSCRYMGTEDVETEDGGRKLGALRSVWDIAYRMDFTDPTT